MSTNSITAPTATPMVHTHTSVELGRSGDYVLDCIGTGVAALEHNGFDSVVARPDWGTVITCEDGDDTVTCGVLVLDPEDYETTLEDVDALTCPEMRAELAALAIMIALESYGDLPLSLRADLVSVCRDVEGHRARVHHVRGVWHS